ncbi:MAG: response regulator [Deltaproteobacteria bacterium]|jgi:two-component system chemotaxis response regulator CheY|nr:response regulator [Deltaproteobacteria bacterium]
MPRLTRLVVEDSPMMRQLLRFALQRIEGMQVDEADDGVAGLKQLAKHTYDIILVDINMPIMDGLKLVKHIRSDSVHKDVPIIIVTTEGNEEDQERAGQLGVDAYITKPIQGTTITEKAKELLGL